MTLTVGALFAGYGGLELALGSELDTRVLWCSEIESAPSRIMARHWPDAPNLGDITKVDWRAVPPVDVITGGSPCQDLSHAGKRKGMRAGTRSGLWASMCDAIDIIRPRLVVWENVRGAFSAKADSGMESCPGCVGDVEDGAVLRALGRVLGDLAELGYDAWWYGLRAADVGAAHGRFRVFVFAQPADADVSGLQGHRRLRAAPGEAQAGARDSAAADAAELGGREAVEHDGRAAPRGDGAGVPDERDREPVRSGPERGDGLTMLPTPAVNDMGDGKTVEWWDEWTASMQARHGNGNGHGRSLAIEAVKAADVTLVRTPTSSTGGSADPALLSERNHEVTLASQMEFLLPVEEFLIPTQPEQQRNLPTPMTGNRRSEKAKHQRPGGGPSLGLEDALLPTPRATRGGSNTETQRDLPTPRASDTNTPGVHGHGGQDLRTVVATEVPTLLPTPRTQNNENRQSEQYGGDTGNYHGLITGTQQWGAYASAIRRQEVAFGRPAPAPTEVNKKGKAHLSPTFVEWLMGLPAGHVTDASLRLSRNDQLKALGNGVVPQQAAAALRAFLHDSQEAPGG